MPPQSATNISNLNNVITPVTVAVGILCLFFAVAILLIILKKKGMWHKSPLELCRKSNHETDEVPLSHLQANKPDDTYDTMPGYNNDQNMYSHFDKPVDSINGRNMYSQFERTGGAINENIIVDSEYDTMANIQAQQEGIYDTAGSANSGHINDTTQGVYDTLGNVRI